jgi:hypothetical protein
LLSGYPQWHTELSLFLRQHSSVRYIRDGPLVLHEIIHELKTKKMSVVLLKLDFEKAYDRVSWQFLIEVLF